MTVKTVKTEKEPDPIQLNPSSVAQAASSVPDELQMIEEVFRRSEVGLRHMNSAYGKLLQSVAMNILHDAEDAEECVNDTWLKVWKIIPPYRPEHLRPFLCKIVRQISIDRFRANHRQKRMGTDTVLWADLDENLTVQEDLADESGLSDGIAEAIESFLAGQDVTARVLFTRRYFLCESLQSLSERYQMDPKILAVRMARLRGKLKKYLEKEGYAP